MPTPTESKVNPFAELEAAALAHHPHRFVKAKQAIDWSTIPAEAYSLAVQLAFQAGAVPTAAELANEGVARFPASKDLQKAARVLAPPKVVGTKPADPVEVARRKADRAWIEAHRDDEAYWGKWLALRSGELLGASSSFTELFERIGRDKEVYYTKLNWGC